MRRLTVIFLSLICAFASMAQVENTEEKGKRPLALRYRVSGATGYILRGSIIEPWIGTRPVLGGEVAVEFMPTGRIESLQWYNNASIGLAFSALDLTNTEILGQAFTPYAYLNIPFVRLPHFVFGIRPGIGLAFVTKTYYNTTDIADRYTALHHADGTPIGNGGSGSLFLFFFNNFLFYFLCGFFFGLFRSLFLIPILFFFAQDLSSPLIISLLCMPSGGASPPPSLFERPAASIPSFAATAE